MKSEFLSGHYKARLSTQVVFETLSMLVATGKAVLDAVYLGRHDEAALIAFGLVFPFMLIVDGMGHSQAMANTALASGCFDPKSRDYRNTRLLHKAIAFSLCVSVVAMLAYALLHRVALNAAIPSWREFSSFIQVYLFAIPFLWAGVVARISLRCLGAEKQAALLNISSLIVSSLLSFALVSGRFGLPACGVAGVAISIVVNAALTCVLFYALLKRRTGIAFFVARFDMAFVRRYCTVALPSFVNNLLGAAFASTLVLLFARLGDQAATAYAVITRLEVFLLIPFAANASAFLPFFAANRNGSDMVRLGLGLNYLYKRMAVMALCAVTICALGHPLLATLLSAGNAGIEPYLRSFLLIMPVGYSVQSVFILYALLLLLQGRGWKTIGLNALRFFVIAAPLAHIATSLFGFEAGLAALALTNAGFGVYAYFGIQRLLLRLPGSAVPTAHGDEKAAEGVIS